MADTHGAVQGRVQRESGMTIDLIAEMSEQLARDLANSCGLELEASHQAASLAVTVWRQARRHLAAPQRRPAWNERPNRGLAHVPQGEGCTDALSLSTPGAEALQAFFEAQEAELSSLEDWFTGPELLRALVEVDRATDLDAHVPSTGCTSGQLKGLARGRMRWLARIAPSLHDRIALALLGESAGPGEGLHVHQWLSIDLLYGGASTGSAPINLSAPVRGEEESHELVEQVREVGCAASLLPVTLRWGRMPSVSRWLDERSEDWRAMVQVLQACGRIFVVHGEQALEVGPSREPVDPSPGWRKLTIQRAVGVAFTPLEAAYLAVEADDAQVFLRDEWISTLGKDQRDQAVDALKEAIQRAMATRERVSDADRRMDIAATSLEARTRIEVRDHALARLAADHLKQGTAPGEIVRLLASTKLDEASRALTASPSREARQALRDYLLVTGARPEGGSDSLFLVQGGHAITEARVGKILGLDPTLKGERPRARVAQARNGRGPYRMLSLRPDLRLPADRLVSEPDALADSLEQLLSSGPLSWPVAELAISRLRLAGREARLTAASAAVLVGSPLPLLRRESGSWLVSHSEQAADLSGEQAASFYFHAVRTRTVLDPVIHSSAWEAERRAFAAKLSSLVIEALDAMPRDDDGGLEGQISARITSCASLLVIHFGAELLQCENPTGQWRVGNEWGSDASWEIHDSEQAARSAVEELNHLHREAIASWDENAWSYQRVDPCWATLRCSDFGMKRFALLALGCEGVPSSLEALAGALAEDAREGVVSIERLTPLLMEPGHGDDARHFAAQVLTEGRLASPVSSTDGPLWELLGCCEARVRTAALERLEQEQDLPTDGPRSLAATAASPYVEVAEFGLSRLKSDDALLWDFLQHGEPNVRAAALELLEQAQHFPVAGPRSLAATAASPYVEVAEFGLSRLKSDDALLWDFLQHGEPNVRAAALELLEQAQHFPVAGPRSLQEAAESEYTETAEFGRSRLLDLTARSEIILHALNLAGLEDPVPAECPVTAETALLLIGSAEESVRSCGIKILERYGNIPLAGNPSALSFLLSPYSNVAAFGLRCIKKAVSERGVELPLPAGQDRAPAGDAIKEVLPQLVSAAWREAPSAGMAEETWKVLLDYRLAEDKGRWGRKHYVQKRSALLVDLLADEEFYSGSIPQTSPRTFGRICRFLLGLKDGWGEILDRLGEEGPHREVTLSILAKVKKRAVGDWLDRLCTNSAEAALWARVVVNKYTSSQALDWLRAHREELKHGPSKLIRDMGKGRGYQPLLFELATHPVHEIRAFSLELMREMVESPEGLARLCESRSRKARELVREYRQNCESVPTSSLLAVARCSNRSSAEWAVAALAGRAEAGEQIEGFSLVDDPISGSEATEEQSSATGDQCASELLDALVEEIVQGLFPKED